MCCHQQAKIRWKGYFFHKSTWTENKVAIALCFGEKGILFKSTCQSVKCMNLKNIKASFTDHCLSEILPILFKKSDVSEKGPFL